MLQDKVSVWRHGADNGAMDLRDYNRRCADALTTLMIERAALERSNNAFIAAAKLALEYWIHRQQRYKNRSPVWVQDTRSAIANAEGRS